MIDYLIGWGVGTGSSLFGLLMYHATRRRADDCEHRRQLAVLDAQTRYLLRDR